MAIIDKDSPYLTILDPNNLSSADLAWVNALIDCGQEYMEDQLLFRKIEAADYTDQEHDGNGWNYIFVKNPPLNSLTDVDIVSDTFDGTQTTTTYAASKFLTKANTGEIRFKPGDFLTSNAGMFTEGFQNVKITYNGGFTTVPEPLKMMLAEFVIQMYDPNEVEGAIEREKIGDYFYAKGKEFFDQMAFSKKLILSSYRIRRVGSYT